MAYIQIAFQVRLKELLNEYGIDIQLDMHDFVLAQLVTHNLESLAEALTSEQELSRGTHS